MWSVAIATYGAVHLSRSFPPDIRLMGGRATSITNEVHVFADGGPPLLGLGSSAVSAAVHANFRHPANYFFAGVGDDQGAYLYLPLIGDATGTSDSLTLLRWFYIGCMVALLAMYPLVFYGLFDSAIVAAIAPVILLWKFSFMENTDIYWILGWAILFGLPLVSLAFRRWREWSPLVLALAVIGGSFASSIRSHAGLPILLAALGVALVRGGTWPRRLALAAVLVVINLSLSSFALEGVRTARDAAIGHPGASNALIAVHPFWHPTYLGLGWLDNKYGIKWNDTIAANAVYAVDPGAGYLTPRYESILRHKWFHIAETNPGFLLRVWWSKGVTLIGYAMERFWLAAAFAIGMVAVARRRKEYARWFAFLVPSIVVLVAPLVLAIPIAPYDVGWLALWGFVWLLGVLWLVEELVGLLEHVFVSTRDAVPLLPTGDLRRHLTLSTAVRLSLIVVLLVGVAATRHVTPEAAAHAEAAFGNTLTESDPLAYPQPGQVVASWRFGGVPHGWSSSPGTTTAAGDSGGSLVISTTTDPSGYQLSGPAVRLSPGRYALVVQANVSAGGMQPGILDVRKDAWVAESLFWSGQWWMGSESKALGMRFTLAKATEIRPILANWAPDQTASHWTVKRVAILRQNR